MVYATVKSNLGVFLEKSSPTHKDIESFISDIKSKFKYHCNVSIKINKTVQALEHQKK